MSYEHSKLTSRLVVAATLALGASGVALADDSSMNPFTGDSWAYFNGGHNLGNFNVTRTARAQGPEAAATVKQGEPKMVTAGSKSTTTAPRECNDNTGG